jgi:hypothetical protein
MMIVSQGKINEPFTVHKLHGTGYRMPVMYSDAPGA